MRLLIIEDDIALANGVMQNLKQQGYCVDHFDRVSLAINACMHEHYDLIILDLGLPDADGLTFLEKYRQKHNSPVIILTARDRVEDKIKGLDLGADDYLLKPFDQSELQARIRALLRRSHGNATHVIEFGPLQLDLNSREVLFHNQPVILSRRELNLLEVLLQNQGKVMSRSSLEQTLYSWDDDIESNALEVHIHNLRKKIHKKLIKTVRGVGYMAVKDEI
ncbi:response regulator [Psychromonas antarctica]|jgi:two-component system response regulator QseB|uniref:response regulator n=1 Tax=Psychromonas antarctica TaxID=67573 RepID=UPI001EE8BCE5|nr:response regulator [Psychromonas antarctica]MCG6200862.1 response regulator [Psychromonas antarctica]